MFRINRSKSVSTSSAATSIGWPGHALRFTAASYLIALIVLPLTAVFVSGFQEGVAGFWTSLSSPVARHALWLTLWTAAVMTVINSIMGTLTAYVLVRYSFPGKNLINNLIDLPFAIPTLVTGVMLVALYGPNRALGAWLKDTWDWQIIFSPSGIILALLFVSLPMVVRSVQPVLMEIDRDQEEAASSLGASGWTIFQKIILPALWPGIVSGSLSSFARALGEFGAIVVVAGSYPMRSQTAAVYVLGEIESQNQLGASSMSIVMIGLSFFLVLAVDWWQNRSQEGR